MYKQLIQDNRERILHLSLKRRNYVFHDEILNLEKIISFIGPRRVGKTYLMFQFVLELIEKGIYTIDQVVFIDFSLYVGEEIQAEDIIKSYYALGSHKKPLFIFDEIQDIANFQKLILQLYTQGYQLLISGSNSKLLSSELVTEFRGRVYEYFIDPLDFDEILAWNDIRKEAVYSSSTTGMIKNIIHNTLKYGTFPELVLTSDEALKSNILKTYFDILLYKDLIERYKIENEKAIRFLIKGLIVGNAKKLNLIKIYNDLKSQGLQVGKNTIYNYYEYLKNIFFVTDVENLYKKTTHLYLYNFGFGNFFGYSDNRGQNFENFIYLNLKKKYKKVFYKEHNGEIDFYIEDSDTNIQVCYKLNSDNFERELKPLLKQDGKKVIIYFDKLGEFAYEGVEIVDFITFLNQ